MVVEINNKKNLIESYEKLQLEEEQTRLKDEKDKIDNAARCSNCHNVIAGKHIGSKIGSICTACFMTYGQEKSREWF
jgi:hypothetical protein